MPKPATDPVLDLIDRIAQSVTDSGKNHAAQGRDLLRALAAIQQDMVALRSEIAEVRSMTRRASDPLTLAVAAYAGRFGVGPPVWQFMGDVPALVRELRAAVARGESVTEADLYRLLKQEPPPPGGVL
jgi:uncharacterized protein (DUF1800 family)